MSPAPAAVEIALPQAPPTAVVGSAAASHPAGPSAPPAPAHPAQPASSAVRRRSRSVSTSSSLGSHLASDDDDDEGDELSDDDDDDSSAAEGVEAAAGLARLDRLPPPSSAVPQGGGSFVKKAKPDSPPGMQQQQQHPMQHQQQQQQGGNQPARKQNVVRLFFPFARARLLPLDGRCLRPAGLCSSEAATGPDGRLAFPVAFLPPVASLSLGPAFAVSVKAAPLGRQRAVRGGRRPARSGHAERIILPLLIPPFCPLPTCSRRSPSPITNQPPPPAAAAPDHDLDRSSIYRCQACDPCRSRKVKCLRTNGSDKVRLVVFPAAPGCGSGPNPFHTAGLGADRAVIGLRPRHLSRLVLGRSRPAARSRTLAPLRASGRSGKAESRAEAGCGGDVVSRWRC
jgi:hypothetical protein